ncbi:MAG: hypothetical protein WAL84_16435 [Candidatus Dormiibacterota bacterium]
MKRRTIGVVLALVAAAAVPLGLPHSASAASFDALNVKPLPIEQPGTLSPTGTNTVTMCVQPTLAGKPITSVTNVFLSIDSALFAPTGSVGGTAIAEGTPLTSTPASLPTQATCSFANLETSGTLPWAIPITYTGPTPTVPAAGRDVIAATSDGVSFSNTTGKCVGPGICDSGTYVYSPVTQYVITPSPTMATTGSLAAGAPVTVTVVAEDASAKAVPGAYLDLSLASTGTSGGSATAFSQISMSVKHLTNLPSRFGADATGTVTISYTAANPLPASGTDTITAQNHPTATHSNFTTYTYATSTAPPKGPYTSVTPFRVCDTRPAAPGIVSNQCDNGSTGAGSGPIGSGATRVITVDNFGGLPASGVTAVVVNLTAIAPTVGTFLTLSPDGVSSRTSNLNPQAGQVRANLVEVGVSAAGKIDVFNALGSVNIVLDIEGFVSSTSTGLFTGSSPVRICDTRAVGGAVAPNRCNTAGASPLGPGATLTFNVNGAPSPVPGTGVSAVVFNLTAINPSVRTVLTAFTGSTRPIASNINVEAHQAVPNRVIVPVTCSGGNCTVSIWNGAGSVNIAVDIDGWFTTGTGTQFTALATPARICDTQPNSTSTNTGGCTKGLVGSGQVLNIEGAGIDGIPAYTGSTGSPVAIVANVTAVNATTGTFITVYPGTVLSAPTASDLNVPSYLPVSNLVVATLGTDGTINLFNALGGVNLIVDVLGYYS